MAKKQQTFQRAARKRKAEQRARAARRLERNEPAPEGASDQKPPAKKSGD